MHFMDCYNKLSDIIKFGDEIHCLWHPGTSLDSWDVLGCLFITPKT